MIIKSIWAMPNSATFKIKPIKELLNSFVGDGIGWADPFAGWNSPAQYTNDLNPNAPTSHHEEAIDFLARFDDNSLKGIIFDPPFSPRQIKECYDSIGLTGYVTNGSFYGKVKALAAKKIMPGGLAFSCGWNSNGFGKNRGFELIWILLVRHGGNHNDTIVTIDIKNDKPNPLR